MSTPAKTRANAAPKGAAPAAEGLKPFIVRFDDWTAYKLTVLAASEDDAIERAREMCTADLWKADVIDGGQEGWEAFPAPEQKGGRAP